MKRRAFLTRFGAAGAAGLLAPAVALASASGGSTETGIASDLLATPSPARYSKAWLESMLGDTFRFVSEHGTRVSARLIGVRPLPGSQELEQFTAVFRILEGDGQGGFYHVEHASAGTFSLMLSPAANPGAGQTWHAHFSLLT